MADNRYKKGVWQGNRKVNPDRIIILPLNEKPEVIRLMKQIKQLKREIEQALDTAKILNLPVSPMVAINQSKLAKLEKELQNV